jgi:hypothetical protein
MQQDPKEQEGMGSGLLSPNVIVLSILCNLKFFLLVFPTLPTYLPNPPTDGECGYHHFSVTPPG